MASWEAYRQTMAAPDTLGAAAKRDDVPALERLLAQGADLEARDSRGYSALMLAAYSGCEDAFAFLLSRGADPESPDAAGNTVLMGAAFKGHLGMVRALLERGADPRRKNAAGLDASGFAAMFGRTDVFAFLKDPPAREAR